jgi:hypothetical protein|tara:strand:- start:880 stop:1821 length:942 start_codon:yes stop_codon:yes gene_type:complete
MFNEDNEAVETVEAEPQAESAVEVSAEPVEAVEATPVEVEEEVEAPPVFEWNGEIEDLNSKEWVQQLDPAMKNAIINGIEGKYQNYQRGYTSKYQELAKQRRVADELMKEVRENELKVQRWMHGDVDPMVAKQREIDELKVAHRSALSTLRQEAEKAHEKAMSSHGAELEAAATARDQALRQYQEVNAQLEQFHDNQVEVQVDQLENWLTSTAKDVYDNDAAFDRFCELAKANITPEDAVKMVRALYPPPAPEPVVEPEPEPEPEPVPEGMKLMNMGPDTASGTEGGDPRSFEEMMDALRKNAMIEQQLLLGN